jgi:hypothetical protein
MSNQNAIIEESVFPAEFLDCFAETAFKTLTDYLIAIDARQEALDLLDNAQLLIKKSVELEHSSHVNHSTNETLMESVTDASRAIVALGGVFYAPSGASMPRESAPGQCNLRKVGPT